MKGNAIYEGSIDARMDHTANMTITRDLGDDIYPIDTPSAFHRLMDLFQQSQVMMSTDDAANIIDACLTTVALAHVRQTPMQEQVKELALMPIFVSFISSSRMGVVESLLNILTCILHELYMMDTAHSFTTDDVAVRIIGTRILIKRKR